jgi:hypothetical protein
MDRWLTMDSSAVSPSCNGHGNLQENEIVLGKVVSVDPDILILCLSFPVLGRCLQQRNQRSVLRFHPSNKPLQTPFLPDWAPIDFK